MITCYNQMLQATNVVQPDGTSVTNIYLQTGLLGETYGSRTYPVQYTYDAQGRVKTMTTWQNFASQTGAATTAWNYDQYRGFLTGKIYMVALGRRTPIPRGQAGHAALGAGHHHQVFLRRGRRPDQCGLR